MSDKIKTGNKGERLAAEFFQEKGWDVVARNYRYGKAEIDLIIQRDDWVIFIEVKTRSSTAFGEPEDFVDGLKINRIFDAAEEWIYANDWHGHIRFDIVSVKLGEETLIEHFEDAIN
ncbi:MAG TPA: YraN family protein [Ohtaekwangia sp.]|nr:YraN family protein [Ohtaekwangia sp.]